MSQPDQAHAVVRRARPASAPAAAPLRVVSERIDPTDAVAAPAPAAHPPAGPAQLRAGFRDASMPAPLAATPCPQPWTAPAWPPRDPAAALGAMLTDAAHLAVVPGAELVPARSLLPVPACPPRPLLARLVALLSGRREPAGRHRPASIESATWSMCTQRRRRSRWRTR